jgi:4-hydroxy-tetrahydrodipicolinate reductase
VKSGNFSLGVNLLAMLVEDAARRLAASDWDIEILEMHHRRKVDAPSGTALMLGRAAARGRGEAEESLHAPTARMGLTGPRPRGGVGFAALRGGGVVGDHSVIFAAEDETLTFSHSARDRSLFARGALTAAAWVADAKPGLYDMRDVLGAPAA